MWCTGLVAPWHMRSSRTRDRTRVLCISRQILIPPGKPWLSLFLIFIFVHLFGCARFYLQRVGSLVAVLDHQGSHQIYFKNKFVLAVFGKNEGNFRRKIVSLNMKSLCLTL